MATSPETPQDKALDHLVDTTGISYGEARQQLGITVAPDKFFTAERIKARNEANAYYTDEFNLSGTPEQTDFYDRRSQDLGGFAIEMYRDDTEQ